MARKKFWKDEIELTSMLPIDITTPKAYVLTNTPFNENNWTRVFSTKSEEIVVARATQKLPLSRDLQLSLEAQNPIDNVEYEVIVDRMRYEMGLDEKMKVLKKLKNEDTLIDIALQANPGFRLFANSDPIEAAILTIISQNTSFFSYLEIVEKLLKKYGTVVPWDKSLYLFPTRSQLAQMSENDWLSLKVGYKAKYLSELNEDGLNDIETYAFYPILERGIEGLRKISGVGNYTARILAIYHSRRYDYAFYDTYVLDVLNHKYEIGNINNQKQFDNWVSRRWPKDPALVIHSLLLEYLPEFLRSHETFYSKLTKTANQPFIIPDKSTEAKESLSKTPLPKKEISENKGTKEKSSAPKKEIMETESAKNKKTVPKKEISTKRKTSIPKKKTSIKKSDKNKKKM